MSEPQESQLEAAPPPARRGPLRFRLFRLAGMSVEMPLSLLPLLAVLAFLLSTRLLPADAQVAGLGTWPRVALGLLVTVATVACALAHDLAHALALAAFGKRPSEVIVFHHGDGHPGQGGASNSVQDLVVAASGPAVTVVLAVAFALAGWAVEAPPPAGALCRFLAIANLLLAVSSLLPGLPLDGGRALRAVGWAVTGSQVTGARLAHVAARAFAVLCLPVGLAASALSGTVVPFIWAALLALALWLQSGVAWRAMRVKAGLAGLSVRDALEPPPPALSRVVSVGDTLAAFADPARLDGPVQLDRRSAFLVDYGGRLGGLVTLGTLLSVPPEERRDTPVGQVSTRLRHDLVLAPALGLETAFARLRAAGLPFLPVIDGQRVVGVVTREGVGRLLDGQGPA